MKIALAAIGFCFAIAVSAAAHGAPARNAWQWDDEERLQARFDPVGMRARVAERQQGQSRGVRHSATDAVPDAAAPIHEYIRGDRHPELLMPWELFDLLMASAYGGNDENREHWRAVTERSAGVELPPDFWSELESATHAYVVLQADLERRFAALHLAASSAEKEQIRAAIRPLNATTCATRAEALTSARARFGQAWFDRLLYASVAPTVVIDSSSPRPAADQLYIERGCR